MSINRERSTAGAAFLAVSASTDGPVARIVATGELDGATSPTFADTVTGTVRDAGTTLVQVHLTHLTFIDSAGIRCLVRCRAQVQAAGQRFELTDPSAAVLDVLAITGLLEYFGIAERPANSAPGRRPPPAPGRSPYRPRATEQVRAEAATMRQAARETRERAVAAREADLLRRLRVRGESPRDSS